MSRDASFPCVLILLRPLDAPKMSKWKEVQRCAAVLSPSDVITTAAHDFSLALPPSTSTAAVLGDGGFSLKFLLTDGDIHQKISKHVPLAEADFNISDVLSSPSCTLNLRMHRPRARATAERSSEIRRSFGEHWSPVLHIALPPDSFGHRASQNFRIPCLADLDVESTEVEMRQSVRADEEDEWIKMQANFQTEKNGMNDVQTRFESQKLDRALMDASSEAFLTRQRDQIQIRNVKPVPGPKDDLDFSRVSLTRGSKVVGLETNSKFAFAPYAVEQHAATAISMTPSSSVGSTMFAFGGVNNASEENEMYSLTMDPAHFVFRWSRLECSAQVPLGRHGHCLVFYDGSLIIIGGIGLCGRYATTTTTGTTTATTIQGEGQERLANCRRSRSPFSNPNPIAAASDRFAAPTLTRSVSPIPHSVSPHRHHCPNINSTFEDLHRNSVEVSLNSTLLNYVIANRAITPIVQPPTTTDGAVAASSSPSSKQGQTASTTLQYPSGFVAEVYSLALNTRKWQLLLSNKDVRVAHHTATVFGSTAYVFGGLMPSFQACNDLWAFDLDARRWFTPTDIKGQPPCPRHSHSAVILGSEIFVFGGKTTGSSNNGKTGDSSSSSLGFHHPYVLDVSKRTWAMLLCSGVRPPRLYGHSAVVHQHRMLVVGGANPTTDELTNGIYELNLANQTWRQIAISHRPSLPPCVYHTTTLCASPDGEPILVVFGGRMRFPFQKKKTSKHNRSRSLSLPRSTTSSTSSSSSSSSSSASASRRKPGAAKKGKGASSNPEVTNECFLLRFAKKEVDDDDEESSSAAGSDKGEQKKPKGKDSDELPEHLKHWIEKMAQYPSVMETKRKRILEMLTKNERMISLKGRKEKLKLFGHRMEDEKLQKSIERLYPSQDKEVKKQAASKLQKALTERLDTETWQLTTLVVDKKWEDWAKARISKMKKAKQKKIVDEKGLNTLVERMYTREMERAEKLKKSLDKMRRTGELTADELKRHRDMMATHRAESERKWRHHRLLRSASASPPAANASPQASSTTLATVAITAAPKNPNTPPTSSQPISAAFPSGGPDPQTTTSATPTNATTTSGTEKAA